MEPTIEDTLRDVHPHTLDCTFHWYAPVSNYIHYCTPFGHLLIWSTVRNACLGIRRRGQKPKMAPGACRRRGTAGILPASKLLNALHSIQGQTNGAFQGVFRSYDVYYNVKRQRVVTRFIPGLQWEMKPDTPEVRELLREAGVFI